jgi:Zn finger protein HypA/HybF involved in hydrogenase expression
MRKTPISKKEFELLEDQRVGYCRACEVFMWGNIGPDEDEYSCESCLAKGSVCGINRALKLELIELRENGTYILV